MIYNRIEKKQLYNILGDIKKGKLKFYQFYNLDFSADEYQFQEYMMKFKEADATTKVLNKSYYDIEVFFDPAVFPDSERAAYMVNSIAVYNNLKNVSTIFTCPFYTDIHKRTKHSCNLTDQETLQSEVEKLYNELCIENQTYAVEGMTIEVRVFQTEKELLKEFFLYLREIYSLFLIGFNSSLFDDPYVVNRGLGLVGEKIYDYMSEFGEVNKFGEKTYEWPDYTKVDLLTMYKPVDQGGNGLGKSLPNYKLDTVAEKELKIRKLDLPVEQMNEEYQNNLAGFLTYNLLDTLLTFKLDEKLQFLELQWMLAKYNDGPISSAIRGRSLMYRYRNDLIYTKKNQAVRIKPYGREIFYPIETGE